MEGQRERDLTSRVRHKWKSVAPGAEESRFKAAALLYPVGTSVAGFQGPVRVERRLQDWILLIWYPILDVTGVFRSNKDWWNLTASNR